ncbi:hypothetical protein [Methylomonas koyamae]|uniref:hypothetical protein n=1 Tax=Methylomonas koyamae TaxID=702114 RepID=UPI00112CC33B|nr:hypothetical protein [Methylomonas koyamae]TPQ25795.1 hypothetical protein C2U68_13930 [Methylomonas koyamae]
MSYIASFYLVKASQAEELVSLAELIPAQKKFLGIFPKKVVDTKTKFWDFVANHVSELNEYEYSGFAFVELFALFPDVTAISKSSLGIRIAKAMDSTYLSFTEHEAQEALSALGSEPPGDAKIRAYFEEDDRGYDASDWVIPVQEAWSTLKEWLHQVHGNEIGLLSVG